MGVAENKSAMHRIIDEVINGKNLEVADQLYADNHQLHPESPGVGRGSEGMVDAFAGLFEQFPVVHATIEAMVAEDDMVAVRLTWVGTDAATGDQSMWPEVVFTRFADGKAAESWELIDTGRSSESAPW